MCCLSVEKNAWYLVIIRIALRDYEYMQIGHIFKVRFLYTQRLLPEYINVIWFYNFLFFIK
jgi:hypothetical protein